METAFYIHRSRRVPELLRKVDDSLALVEKAKEDDSISDMIHWLGETARAWCDRQWSNRVFLRAQ
jgi:hypothetical protein